MTRSALALVAVLAVCLPGPAAQAQPDGRQEARTSFDAGVRAFQSGDLAAALESFERAYDLQPHPAVLINIGHCQLGLGHPVEAARELEHYLRHTRDLPEDPHRAEVQQALGRARAEIATLEVTGPDAVQVRIDGVRFGTTPLPRAIEVNPGEHVVGGAYPTGPVREEHITVHPGESISVRLEPEPAARVTPVRGATTEPTAGVLAPPAPSQVARATPAQPRAPMNSIGRTSSESAARVRPTMDAGPADREPEGTEGGVPLMAWIGGGTTIAALALGVGFGATATSQESDFEEVVRNLRVTPFDDPRRATLEANGQAIADARAANALAADVFFGIAAAAAAVTVYAYVSSDAEGNQEPRRRVTIQPVAGGAMALLEEWYP